MKALLQLLAFLVPAVCSAVNHNVTVNQNAYHPATLDIAVGDRVIWTFLEGNHSVTSGANCTANGIWDSDVKNAGQTFERVFETDGSFPYYSRYYCQQGATGVIRVGTASIGEGKDNKSFDLNVFPNPFVNSAVFRFQSEKTGQAFLDITTMDGKLISTEKISVHAGENTVQLSLDIPAGMYLVRLQLIGTLPETRIIVKQAE